MTEKSDFHFYDLLLMAQARQYDLYKGGRQQSNKDITLAFIILNTLLKPEVTYEIGAFEAQFSITIRKLLPQTKVIAFEANPYNFTAWKNREKPAGIDYLYLAISDHTGESEFYVQKTLQGMPVQPDVGNNSLLQRAKEGVEYEVVKVPASTLEDYAKQNGLENKHFTAWIDVEGASAEVLKGAGELWKSCSALFIEVEEQTYWKDQWLVWDVAEYLMQQGFVPIIRDFEYEHQYNLIFIKKDLLKNPDVRGLLTQNHLFSK